MRRKSIINYKYYKFYKFKKYNKMILLMNNLIELLNKFFFKDWWYILWLFFYRGVIL